MTKKNMKKNSGQPPKRIAGIHNVCVFCGSGTGRDPAFVAGARTLGQHLAEAGIGLVYGGGSLGLMGEVARSVLRHDGYVTGIIPSFLSEKEQMLRDVNELIVTEDMHQRKRLMFERSDAFVALPGGIGTLEELVEQLTWAQLGRHTKPIVIANIAGYWDSLRELFDHMREETFIRAGLQVPYTIVDNAEDILPAIAAAAPAAPKERVDVIERM
ncbi:MAG: TIGR00730 family Rossman fold protein [Hyphomicrobiaceae bacterium]